MALGFWGVGFPLGLFGILFCKTPVERLTALLLASAFLVVGALVYRARR